MIKLSSRLKAIADFVGKGETVADVGTDHGFLPLYLLTEGISPFVIMTDVSPGSLEKARQSCYGRFPDDFDEMNGEKFSLRLGDGLVPIKPAEVDTVVMAGMGGLLMAEILSLDPEKTESIHKFILQPRNNLGRLRKWLALSGFSVEEETLVRERDKICEILSVRPVRVLRNPPEAADLDEEAAYEYPDILAMQPNDLTEEYLKRHLEKERLIKERILKGRSREKLPLAGEKIARIERLLGELDYEDK